MRAFRRSGLAAMVLVMAACGGGAVETTTTATTVAAPTTTTLAATTTTSDAALTISLLAGEGVTVDDWTVEGGRPFTIAWTGPNGTKDYLTIVPAGADEGAYLDYFYTADGPSGELQAPVEPGEYEVRYVEGATEYTLARQALTIVAAAVRVTAPAEVGAGTVFSASWVGPDGPGDYLTIVPAGADEGAYETYYYTADGSTGDLVAPIEAGDFEVRYVNGSESATLAVAKVVVTPLDITIEAPAEVEAGAEFSVSWTGPDGPSDYLTIVAAGSAEGAYLSYAYTAAGNPVTLLAPEETGDYEIWYASDRVPGTFASIPIVVK